MNLVKYGEFAFEPGKPTALRPPVYPAFVAGVYWLFGVDDFQAVRAVQAVLSLVTVVMLYAFGGRIGGRKVGLWLAGLYCFYPSLLWYNNLLLTETLCVLLMALFALVMVRYLDEGSLVWAAFGGGLIGLTAMERSVYWLFPPVLAAYLLIAGRGPLRCRAAAAALSTLIACTTMAPWAVRTSRLEHTLTVVDATGGRNFMMGNYEFTPMFRAWDAIDIQGDKSWGSVVAAAHPEYRGMTQGQRDKLALRAGLEFVTRNPLLTAQRDLVKFFNFWQLEREVPAGAARGYFGRIPGSAVALLTLVVFGGYAACVMSGVYGFFLAAPDDRRKHWLLLLLIGFLWALHTLSFGHSRYHLPIIPFVLAYSASALSQAKRVWQQRFSLPGFAAAVTSCLLLASWIVEIAVSDWDRYVSVLKTIF